MPPRARGVAAARLARTQGLHLRPVRREPTRRGRPRPDAVSRTRHQHAPRVLDAADVRAGEALGQRRGRAAGVLRRERPELRGGVARRCDDLPQRRAPRPRRGGPRRAREPHRDVPRVRSQSPRRGVHADRRNDRRPVPRPRRRPLGLHRNGAEERRAVREEVAAPALPRRGVGPRDGQGVAEFPGERREAGEGPQP